MQLTQTRALGAAAILLALGYNIAFSILASSFNYPDILRSPAAMVLAAFAQGGEGLILTWYLFALTAVAFVPLSIALAFAQNGVSGWSVAGAILGGMAGLVQAIGLLRWVFAIPTLAASQDPAAPLMFDLLNLYGGVALGEYLGQTLTALYLIAMGLTALHKNLTYRAAIAGITAGVILIGSQEGVALALGRDTGLLPLFSVAGYIGLSLWLCVVGFMMVAKRA